MGPTYSECVFVALDIQQAKRIYHMFICYIFRIISQTARFS